MSDSPISFLDVAGMVAAPPPPVDWLAARVLPRSSLVMLYAPGGDGKSLLSMGLAAAIAHGGELAGIECKNGVTIYLDAENGPREIHRRVYTLGLPSSGVRIADAGGLDLRRHMPLVAELARERPDLLVLDSFRSMTPGLDENDTAQTARVIDNLRRLAHDTGTTILLIHHANKSGKQFRGASSIRDAVDVLWHLGRHDGDDDSQRRFLHNDKMRPARDGERFWLRLEIDRGRVLVDAAEPPDEAVSTAAQPVRRALSDRILASMNGQTYRLADVAALVGRGAKDGSVRNALSALVDAGLVTRHGYDYAKVHASANGVCTSANGAMTLGGPAPLHRPVNALTADVYDEAER